MKKMLTEKEAVSWGAYRSRVQVIAASTPEDLIVEELAILCTEDKRGAKFVMVRSEQAALAVGVGASATGSRVFTVASAHSLVPMHELLYKASLSRLPVVVVDINRAMVPGGLTWTGQIDSLAHRDTGWFQFHCESSQEVMDTIIQAYRISEQVLLPGIVVLAASAASHAVKPVDIPNQKSVDRYLKPCRLINKLDVNDPHSFAVLDTPENCYESYYKMQKAMGKALQVAEKADDDYGKLFGRGYGLVEKYRCQGAETILVTYGTITGTVREVVDQQRARGKKVGLLKVRLFRPFPARLIRSALSKARKVAVIDGEVSPGSGGILHQEVTSSLFKVKPRLKAAVFGFVVGLSGDDIAPDIIQKVVDYTTKRQEPEEKVIWLGVKR